MECWWMRFFELFKTNYTVAVWHLLAWLLFPAWVLVVVVVAWGWRGACQRVPESYVQHDRKRRLSPSWCRPKATGRQGWGGKPHITALLSRLWSFRTHCRTWPLTCRWATMGIRSWLGEIGCGRVESWVRNIQPGAKTWRRSPGARSLAASLRRRARRRLRARGKSGGSANESGCQTRLLQGCADREVLEQQTSAPGLEELWEKKDGGGRVMRRRRRRRDKENWNEAGNKQGYRKREECHERGRLERGGNQGQQ